MALTFRSPEVSASPYARLIAIVRDHLAISEREIESVIEKLCSRVKLEDGLGIFLKDAVYQLGELSKGGYGDELAVPAAICATEATKEIVAEKLQDTTGIYYSARQVVGDLAYAYMVVELMLNTLASKYLRGLIREGRALARGYY